MTASAGPILRTWRTTRRLSQLDLSLHSGVSQRHLSFVETGRANPSRQLLLHLGRVLDMPPRDVNAMLLAAGYAAVHPQTGWDDAEFAPVRAAIELLLAHHDPFPAVVLDRHWNLVAANDAAAILTATVTSEEGLRVADGNAMRLLLHPAGMRAAIRNFDEAAAHLIDRLRRDAARYPEDETLRQLCDEMLELVGDVEDHVPDGPLPLLVPVAFVLPDGRELRTFSMLASVGGALDVTLSELVVELFHPADEDSAEVLRSLSG